MVRRLAVTALEKMARDRCLAQAAVNPLIQRGSLKPEDQGFLWEVVHGVTRHRVTIDRILTTFSRLKLAKVQPRVLQALRLAVYQIVYLDRVPVPSAVYESVEIVKQSFPEWVVAFANGCLRGVARGLDVKVGGLLEREDLRRAVPISGQRFCMFKEPIFPDPREDLAGSLALRHAHPRWLVERWLELFGEETTEDVLRAGNEPPSLWLRASPGRLPALARELGKRSILIEVEEEPPGAVRLLQPAGQIADMAGYHQGWFVVQDRTPMRAGVLLDPQPGERVLDLCAAPGGKCTHLAQLVGPEGSVVSVDRDEGRLSRLSETVDRLGLGNVATVVADAREADLDLDETFSRVMVDVPCSNTGVLAKRVEVRHRVQPRRVEALTRIQAEILDTAIRHLAPGGTLVYSTCALLPEENRGIPEAAIAEGAPLEIAEDHEILPRAGYWDGGYLARLVHTG
jgi:16S rRNA (cytosine967-C5)-methyltransferase